MHYGSEFLPFHELLPNLVDEDAAWALKVDEPDEESDYDDGEHGVVLDGRSSYSSEIDSLPVSNGSHGSLRRTATLPPSQRERNSSVPLPGRSLTSTANPNPNTVPSELSELNPRQQLRDLCKLAAEVNATDSEELAQEITRLEVKLFLDIEVCHA